ncbi:MAG: HlyC/CorC family transporter [Chloroflexi bacterium]|nr:HlyC/CorC family transporter [Chloroflexota bacterium]
MDSNVLLILIFLITLVFSGFFSASEAAFLSVQRGRLITMVRNGVKGAQRVLEVRDHPEKMLPTVLTGNNLVNTSAAAIGTILAISFLGEGSLAVVTATVTVTVFLLIFGEIIPKTFAAHYAERLAILFVRPLKAAEMLLLPVVWVLERFSRVLVRFFGVSDARLVAEEEIRAMIYTGQEVGAVQPQEARMLQQVFEFGDKEMREVMTPRTEVVSLEKGATLEDFFKVYIQHSHTRFPVYEGGLDNVLGTVSSKDVLREVAEGTLGPKDDVTTLLRPAFFVPETKKVGDLFSELRGSGYQLVMVADEFGGVAGLATLKQMVEVVVGRVGEEGAPVEDTVMNLGENAFQVEGSMRVNEVNEYLGAGIPTGEYETIAGFLLARMGRIPKPGDDLHFNGFLIEVAEMKGVKIEKVRISRETAAVEGEEA